MALKKLALLFAIGLILFASCTTPSAPQGQAEESAFTSTPSGEGIEPIPEAALKAKFGHHAARHFDTELEKSREERVASGVFWGNYHLGYATWQEIEPSEGNYNWAIIDAYVKGVQASGVQILFTI